MKITSHIEKIRTQVIATLSNDKEILLQELAKVLRDSSELLNTDKLLFWEKQLEKHPWDLIPTTKAGVKQELHRWQNYEPSRKTLLTRLHETCERVLVYWEEDDLCEMQGQYFFYKDEDSQSVFKESEYGHVKGKPVGGNNKSESTIALIPDLHNSHWIRKDIKEKMY